MRTEHLAGLMHLAGYTLPLAPDHAARLLVRALGGPGSGNFGHAGRPGEVGGSAAGVAASIKADTWYHGSTATDLTEFNNEKIKGTDYGAPYTGIWLSTDERTSSAMVNPRALYVVEPIKVEKVITRPEANLFSRELKKDPDYEAKFKESGAKGDGDYTRRKLLEAGYDVVLHDEKPVIDIEELERTGSTKFKLGWRDAELRKEPLFENDPQGRISYELYQRGEHITGYESAQDLIDSESRTIVILDATNAKIVEKRPSPWQRGLMRAAASTESPLHRVADTARPKFSVAFRYAFAVGRKTYGGGRPNADRIVAAMKKALDSVLEPMIVKVLAAGGEVGGKQLKGLRVAGGPGSGNFGHAGRKGQVGGSSNTGGEDDISDEVLNRPEVLKDLQIPKVMYHVTSSEAAKLIQKNGLRPGEQAQSTLGKPRGVYLTDDPYGVNQGAGDIGGDTVLEVRTEGLDLRLDPEFFYYSDKSEQSARDYVAAVNKREEAFALYSQKVIPPTAILSVKKLRGLAGPIKFQFNALSPSLLKWAKKHAAELITQVTDTTRERIALAIEELGEEGDWDLATDRITAAIGDPDRAERIAAHETMLAASEGQRQAWDQAVDAGLLKNSDRRVCIVTPDERLCPVCAALEDATAPLNGTYPGGYDGPPFHKGCRCTEGIA